MLRPGVARALLAGLAVLFVSACSDDGGGPRGEKTFVPTQRLTLSDGNPHDQFGVSVAIEGRTVVVGTHHKTIDGKASQGAAYVFTRRIESDEFRQVATLTAADGQAEHGFGWAVSLSGDTIAVAAPFADVGPGGTEGAAYVFVRPRGGWTSMTETAKLTASDGMTDDDLGSAIAISGDTVVVGAPVDDAGAGEAQGAAYVFVRPRSGWASMTETAKLTASDGAAGDNLGSAVAIDRDVVAVGSPGHAVGGAVEQGAVYVFAKPLAGWTMMTETAELVASDGTEGDRLGRSVGIDGSTIAAGAYLDSASDGDAHGSAYVFVASSEDWSSAVEAAKLTASGEPEHESLGWSIAIRDDTIVTGAILADVEGVEQGAAYVFLRPARGWVSMTEPQKLVGSDSSDRDFGFSVSTDGHSIASGAPSSGGESPGAAYLFESRRR